MSKRVLKYPLTISVIRIETGMDSKVVLSGFDRKINQYCMWIEETPRHHGAREFQVFGTGHDVPEDAVHMYSWIDGPMVWHLYELVSSEA